MEEPAGLSRRGPVEIGSLDSRLISEFFVVTARNMVPGETQRVFALAMATLELRTHLDVVVLRKAHYDEAMAFWQELLGPKFKYVVSPDIGIYNCYAVTAGREVREILETEVSLSFLMI